MLERGSDDVDALRTECPSTEVPITGGDVLRERYPELGVLDRDLVATYVDDWKVVVGSDGSACAWKDGEHRPVGDAPAVALETGQERLDGLKREGRGDVSDADESHLEALGYL